MIEAIGTMEDIATWNILLPLPDIEMVMICKISSEHLTRKARWHKEKSEERDQSLDLN